MFGETNCGHPSGLCCPATVLRMAKLSPNCGDKVTAVGGAAIMDQAREDRIRERAYLIWLREGRPEGRDKVHLRLASDDIDREDRLAATWPAP